jgi:hypothetical protein
VSVFDLDTKGQQALGEQATLGAMSASDVPASSFSGLGKGIRSGIMRGGARVGQFLGMAAGALMENAEFASPEAVPLDTAQAHAEANPEAMDRYFGAVDEYANNAVDYWTPSHAEVGKAGQVLGGFGEIVLPLMAAGGNPTLLIGSQEMGQSTDLARQGVDARTAVKAGVIQGSATAVGFKIPFLGSTLTSRMVSGAAGNIAVNASATAAEHALLESRGYKELAAQYDPFDVEARAIDVLSGMAFGTIAHAQAPRIDRAAVAAANNAKHFQRDTAPGAPADVGAQAAHQQALETAIDQLLRGEPVSVPEAVTRADFTPRDRSATAAARIEAAADEGIDVRRSFTIPDAQIDSALEYLTKSGGVNVEQAIAEGLDPADLRAQRLGIRRTFNRKGMSLESAGERLAQAGYPVTDASGAVDKNMVLDVLDRELRGTKVYSANRAASELAREFDQRAAEQDEAAASGSTIPSNESLTSRERAIETRFREQIGGDVEGAIRQYASLPESDGGRVLNTDLARELSPEYRADRTQSAAVHEPASWLVKEMYRRMLEQEPGPGQEPRVVFTAGGTGAGKSTAIEQLAETADVVRTAQVVYDTNLNSFKSALEKVEQAIQAGKEVEIFYVSRDPVEALTAGALPRAMRMGRTVPLVEHARTHVGSAETIRKLAEHYEGDPRVHIEVIDNSRGKGNAALGSIEKLPALEYNSVERTLREALQAERQAGRISDAVYRGTLGHDQAPNGPNAGSGEGQGAPARAGSGEQPQQADELGRVSQDDPLTSSVRASLAEADIQIPTGEVDADGNIVTQSARAALEQADAAITQAQASGKGILAAVTCFLQRGT